MKWQGSEDLWTSTGRREVARKQESKKIHKRVQSNGPIIFYYVGLWLQPNYDLSEMTTDQFTQSKHTWYWHATELGTVLMYILIITFFFSIKKDFYYFFYIQT